MKDKNISSKNGSSLINKDESPITLRIKQALGKRKPTPFAKSAGIGESLMRQYISGSMPGADKIALIAKEANVSANWLITGEGEMRSDAPKGGTISVSVSGEEDETEERSEQTAKTMLNNFSAITHDYNDATEQIGYNPPILIRESLKTAMYCQGLTKTGAIIILNALKLQKSIK